MNKLRVINLFAGPSSGKSTTAAYVFAKLKLKGYNVELITEYAKDLVYSGRKLDNQLYMTAKQEQRQRRILEYGKVPLVITDSPLLLGLYYGKDIPYFKQYESLLLELAGGYDNFNCFIYRVKPYNPSGRVGTEADSDNVSNWILGNIEMDMFILGDEVGANQLVEKIEEMLREVKIN